MILLTGASGFVGKRVLKQLLDAGEEVVCLARTPEKFQSHKNLTIIKADLELSDVLFNSSDLKKLKNITRVAHIAAIYDLSASAGACYAGNVVATMNLLALLRKLKNFKYFCHISTVAVAGDFEGSVPADKVELGQSFPNPYSKTKAQVESLLRRELKPEQLCILRPGIIIGDSKSGEFDKVDGPYMAVEFFKKLADAIPMLKTMPILPLPIDSDAQLPLITVDVVVNIICQAVSQGKIIGSYHIVMADAPSVKNFSQELFKHLGFKGKIKPIAGATQLSKLFKALPTIPNFPAPLMDYMASKAKYDVSDESSQFPEINNIRWTEIQDKFFREAIRKL